VSGRTKKAAGTKPARTTDGQTIVLAYSGGLDTSVAVAWLRETYGFEVVTCTGDLGSVKDLAGIQRKAIQSGAKKAIVHDAREPFVQFFLWPALQAGALYEGRYPLATALGRRARASWHTARRARATIRCASISPSARSHPR
jgi:argininosuccinate synthase